MTKFHVIVTQVSSGLQALQTVQETAQVLRILQHKHIILQILSNVFAIQAFIGPQKQVTKISV